MDFGLTMYCIVYDTLQLIECLSVQSVDGHLYCAIRCCRRCCLLLSYATDKYSNVTESIEFDDKGGQRNNISNAKNNSDDDSFSTSSLCSCMKSNRLMPQNDVNEYFNIGLNPFSS